MFRKLKKLKEKIQRALNLNGQSRTPHQPQTALVRTYRPPTPFERGNTEFEAKIPTRRASESHISEKKNTNNPPRTLSAQHLQLPQSDETASKTVMGEDEQEEQLDKDAGIVIPKEIREELRIRNLPVFDTPTNSESGSDRFEIETEEDDDCCCSTNDVKKAFHTLTCGFFASKPRLSGGRSDPLLREDRLSEHRSIIASSL